MAVDQIDDVERLKKINAVLIERVERSIAQQGSAFSLFQIAINLENRVRSRTDELHTALKRLEQSNTDLVVAKEAAEEANLSKTRFLAAASHDVLQPLNAAHLSISALADLQTTSEGTKLVRQVERSLETMEDLLRTLLDISKLDAGVMTPQCTAVALDELFQSIRSDFQPIADQKGLKLRFRPARFLIQTDRTMLRRILQNIVSNAIRYTDMGGVLVTVRQRARATCIEVWDTGNGIPEEQHEKIFEEFYRGRASSDTSTSGTGLGLGLAIVQRLAQALNYRVTFTSIPDKGTVFRIEMPAGSLYEAKAPAPAVRRETPNVYGLFGTKVLLIENDRQVLASMTVLLERWKCTVRSASTLAETLQAIGNAAWIPDIIVADQHLDFGDLGIVVTRQVRMVVGKSVPAIIVSADAGEALAAACWAAGIDLMQKPVKPAHLRSLMAHLLA